MNIFIIIALCVVAYLIIGLASEYMKGYSNPILQARSSTGTDWMSMLAWPWNFASTVGNYGAAKRVRWKD